MIATPTLPVPLAPTIGPAAPPRPRRRSERITFRILVPLALAMALLLATFVLSLSYFHLWDTERDAAAAAGEVRALLRADQAQKAALMTTTLQAMMNDEQLAQALRARNREALLDRALPLYRALSLHHRITHLYFHGPDRLNLLRVHHPEQHGDLIERRTLRDAERTGRVTSGMERGPLGTFVLRVVAPWRRDGQLLGYLELGVEFKDIVNEIHGVLDVDFVVAVRKNILNRKLFEQALAGSGQQGQWDQFPSIVVMDKTMTAIPQPVLDYLGGASSEAGGSGRLVSWNGQQLQLAFLPLEDMGGQPLGEMVVLRDVTESKGEIRSYSGFVALICLAVGALLTGLFFLFLTRVERDLAERTAKLDATHKRLAAVSRQAGIAEFATGILHNVGNVLNSVNVGSACIAANLRKSKVANLSKVADLIGAHQDDLGHFFTRDPKGVQLPAYLAQLAQQLAGEQAGALKQLSQLQRNIEHIRDIVTTQQGGARTFGGRQAFELAELVDEALRMASSSHGGEIAVTRDFAHVPPAMVEQQRVLQILVNLLANALQSCDAACRQDPGLVIRTRTKAGRVQIAITDNGVGIPAGDLARIFSHGFTTKKDGHGFGLHSCVLAAREMGGHLSVHSDGAGLGATFTLDLPIDAAEDAP